ncbi:hypothetical protein ACQ4PT_045157 [Festuca glaucescens]
MSSLKAWEVVRTCVLARRWRYLWVSAPCVDLHVRYSGLEDDPPEEFRDFVHRLFLLRDVSASVDTLRLRSSDEDDANTWIRVAINRNARVIHLAGHRKGVALLDRVPFISCHLKILRLAYARPDDRNLKQLSSSCTSLEELDLKDCLVTGTVIASASLKTLIMLKCKICCAFSIAAPNLLLLRLITPYVRVPSFKNLGSLVIGTIILDGSFLGNDFEHISDEDDCDETTDDDIAENHHNDNRENYKFHDGPSLSDDDFGYVSDDDDFDKFGYVFGFPKQRHGHIGYKDNFDYGSDIDSDENTYEYSEIPNDAEFGYKVELTDAREVVLSRELKMCPTFISLKTLSLGKWCRTADFDALIFLLQHSPNIEKLFLQLKINFNTRKTLETGITPQGRSFTCKDLQAVKIKCSKDDARVHKLAHLFRDNGISLEKIYVRRSGSAYLCSQKGMKEFAKHELEFWGM